MPLLLDIHQFYVIFSKKKRKTFAQFAKSLYLCTRFRKNGSTLARRALRIGRRWDRRAQAIFDKNYIKQKRSSTRSWPVISPARVKERKRTIDSTLNYTSWRLRTFWATDKLESPSRLGHVFRVPGMEVWREIFYNEEFDPGSGWTLATGLTHASRGAAWRKLASSDGDRRTGE